MSLVFNSVKFRNGLVIPAYIKKVDMGLALLSRKICRKIQPFRNFENIWASLEVFNL
jgi:hypothetical protein